MSPVCASHLYSNKGVRRRNLARQVDGTGTDVDAVVEVSAFPVMLENELLGGWLSSLSLSCPRGSL